MNTPLNIFISYSHHDESFKERLDTCLTRLKRDRIVEVWHDRRIDPGENWRAEIQQAMDACNVALLLVSIDFLASDFIDSNELSYLLERRKKDGIRVVPIILKPCSWKRLDIAGIQVLPKDGVPIIKFAEDNGDRDQVWTDIADHIAGWAESAKIAQPQAVNASTAVNPFNPWQEATPPRFFGRKELLRRLGMALDEKRSVSLVGDWRIGKTSVLRTWQQKAEERGRTVRYLSGQGPEAVSCAAFVKAASGLETPEKSNDEASADAAADLLAQWAQAVSPGLPPLILIDEADACLPRLPARFFERLRGMLGTLCLVIASRREIDQIYADVGRTSPFANQLQMHRLGLLEADAANQLIALGGEVLSDDDRELMRRLAGRHPYFLALLGRYLWEARRHGGDLEEAVELFRDEAAARFRELWKVLSEHDRAALQGLSAGHATPDNGLKRRGLAETGKLFGEVLETWLKNQ